MPKTRAVIPKDARKLKLYMDMSTYDPETGIISCAGAGCTKRQMRSLGERKYYCRDCNTIWELQS